MRHSYHIWEGFAVYGRLSNTTFFPIGSQEPQPHREEKRMSAKTWKANIRLANGLHQQIRVQADSLAAAHAMIEAMYGKGCLLQGPWSTGG